MGTSSSTASHCTSHSGPGAVNRFAGEPFDRLRIGARPADAAMGRRGATPDRGSALSADARRIIIAAATAFRESAAACLADATGDAGLASDYRRRIVHVAHVVGDPADVRALAAAFAAAANAPPDDDFADIARALGAVANFVESINALGYTFEANYGLGAPTDDFTTALRVLIATLLAAAPRAVPPFNTLDNLFAGV